MTDTQASSRILGKLRSSLSDMGVAGLQSTPQQDDQQVHDDDNLTVLHTVIDSVLSERETQEQSWQQEESTLDELNPPETAGSSSRKESLGGGTFAPELGTSQYVEYEPSPEIPPEVESFMHKVEEMEQDHPHEVIVADGSIPQSNQHHPSKPVVVIPMTKQDEEIAQKKDPTWSIKWLTEWGKKIMRIFVGKVIYQDFEK